MVKSSDWAAACLEIGFDGWLLDVRRYMFYANDRRGCVLDADVRGVY